MSDLARSPKRTPRRVREQRAYSLVVAGGGAATVAVVTGALAFLGIIGFTVPLLALVLAVVCALLFKRAVS